MVEFIGFSLLVIMFIAAVILTYKHGQGGTYTSNESHNTKSKKDLEDLAYYAQQDFIENINKNSMRDDA